MFSFRRRAWAAPVIVTILALALPVASAWAQSGEQKPADPQQRQSRPAEQGKEGQKTVNQFAEAARLLGGPAANPECVWHGRRAVSLLWRDDVDTAFRHLDLYDRFGCPSGHVQATFRCLVLQGDLDARDPKVNETINDRVHACWVSPSAQATAATPTAPATASAPTGQAPSSGTSTR
jgi:hypothetical protein